MKEDKDLLLDGNGLFANNSILDISTKQSIVEWYSNLSEEDRININILRYEVEYDEDYLESKKNILIAVEDVLECISGPGVPNIHWIKDRLTEAKLTNE